MYLSERKQALKLRQNLWCPFQPLPYSKLRTHESFSRKDAAAAAVYSMVRLLFSFFLTLPVDDIQILATSTRTCCCCWCFSVLGNHRHPMAHTRRTKQFSRTTPDQTASESIHGQEEEESPARPECNSSLKVKERTEKKLSSKKRREIIKRRASDRKKRAENRRRK